MVDGNTDPRKNRIEEYRKKIAVRPLETPKQYRSRVGRISRHRYLMNHRPDPARRKREIESYHEAAARVTGGHGLDAHLTKPFPKDAILAEIAANCPADALPALPDKDQAQAAS